MAGQSAYNSVPRESIGAWDRFAENFDDLPTMSSHDEDQYKIGSRLVIGAVKDAPVFTEVRGKVLAYLANLDGATAITTGSDELAEIASIEEISAATGATTADKVRAYIHACETAAKKHKEALRRANEESKQTAEDLAAAQTAVTDAVTSVRTASEIVSESEVSGTQSFSDAPTSSVEVTASALQAATSSLADAASALEDASHDNTQSSTASTLGLGVGQHAGVAVAITAVEWTGQVTDAFYTADSGFSSDAIEFVLGDWDKVTGGFFDEILPRVGTLPTLGKRHDKISTFITSLIGRTLAYEQTDHDDDVLANAKKSVKAVKAVIALMAGKSGVIPTGKGADFIRAILADDIIGAEYRIQYAIVNNVVKPLTDDMQNALNWTIGDPAWARAAQPTINKYTDAKQLADVAYKKAFDDMS